MTPLRNLVVILAGVMPVLCACMEAGARGEPPQPEAARPAVAVQDPGKGGILWLASYGYDLKENAKSMMLFGYNPVGQRVKEIELGIHPRDPNYSIGVTPDGKSILFLGKDGRPTDATTGLTLHIHRLDDPKAKPRDVKIAADEGTNLGIPGERGMDFVASPDGKFVVRNRHFQVERDGQLDVRYEAEIFDLATGKKRDIKLPENTHVVLWSADGKWVLGMWVDPVRPPLMTVRNTKVLKIPLDGKKVEELPGDIPFARGGHSPDGKSMLGVVEKKVVRYDFETKRTTIIATEPRLVVAGVAWSPDGKRVAILGRYADPDPFSQGLPVKNVSHSIITCDPDGKNAKTIFEVKDPADQSLIFCGWTP